MFLVKGLLVTCALASMRMAGAELTASRWQEAVNSFSVDLLKELAGGRPGNLVFSPVSAATVLALLLQGAKGDSSRQLKAALRLGKCEAREGYGRLSRSMQEERDTTAVLEAASRVFARPGLDLSAGFRRAATRNFGSGLEEVDFSGGDGPEAINSWVSRATHGRIPSIVGDGLSPDVVLVLANAVYFKSPWRHPFSRSMTSNGTFSRLAGSEVTAPFMQLGKLLQAGEDPSRGVKWVRLPFVDGGFQMIIVVPNEKRGLARVLTDLTHEDVKMFTQTGDLRFARVKVPRFKIDSNINLVPSLRELGVTDIFEAQLADLRGVSPCGGLVVSRVLQKADMDVDEEGATASAATVVEMERKSSIPHFNPITIEADHPFLALIADEKGSPIFVAVVEDPSA
ncbi:serpin B6-like [Bacillus rossius redtenbacheri]|uniref:serpin B6-like n=1 Tax=Bacillus rossius redtenbacheri TaxID=93214 RepID=UPI002FDED00D